MYKLSIFSLATYIYLSILINILYILYSLLIIESSISCKPLNPSISCILLYKYARIMNRILKEHFLHGNMPPVPEP